MKRKTLIVIFCVVIVSITSFFYIRAKQINKISALLLDNVEALAGNEGDDFSGECIGHGSLDCPAYHVKVEYILEGVSLRLNREKVPQ